MSRGLVLELEADLVVNQLQEGNVGDPQAWIGVHQGTAEAAPATAVELADPPRDEVNQDVGVPHLFHCLASQFNVHAEMGYAKSVKSYRATGVGQWQSLA